MEILSSVQIIVLIKDTGGLAFISGCLEFAHVILRCGDEEQ